MNVRILSGTKLSILILAQQYHWNEPGVGNHEEDIDSTVSPHISTHLLAFSFALRRCTHSSFGVS